MHAERWRRLQLPAVAMAMLAGGSGWLAGAPDLADLAFGLATALALIPAVLATVRDLRAGDTGVDVIAVLAMVGALLLGELLAGAIIALMLTGGEALEEHAAGRARRELTSLLARAPRVAHRLEPDGSLADLDVDTVVVGDELLVKGGEVVPVDGVLLSAQAIVDASALTGEAVPVEITAGRPVSSGMVASGGSLQLRATASAAASTYAGIVRLVEQAATERAPFVRLADRYAGGFVLATLVVAAAAWAVSGDPVRALAVLVVATPCPLILAAPAAIVGGLSAAAKRGIIVKGGGALEALAAGEVVLLDKTGTLTTGRPQVAQVQPVGDLDRDEVLRLAASLDQVSVHPFAPAIVAAAADAGVTLTVPSEVVETLGRGITGRVDGRLVTVGQFGHVVGEAPPPTALRRLRRRASLEGSSLVAVGVDHRPVAGLLLHDPVRADTPRALRLLRDTGIDRVVLLTGDRLEVAELVAETVGIDRVLADRRPEDKVDAVRQARRDGTTTIMVGDGINDAPALALADVGVAMGVRGATAASEAADVVLTVDRLEALGEAVRLARRTRRIAWQSVVVGIGLSVIAMIVAAAGYLPPVAGALLQEVIDLAVLANALRALRVPGRRRRTSSVAVDHRALADHRQLRDDIERLPRLAERLEELDADRPVELRRVRDFLRDELLPQELEEERTIYPTLRAAVDGEDPTDPLIRSHRQIARRIRLFDRLVEEIGVHDPDPDELDDLRRALYGLHAVLELHLGLEDELYSQLPVSPGQRPSPRDSDSATSSEHVGHIG